MPSAVSASARAARAESSVRAETLARERAGLSAAATAIRVSRELLNTCVRLHTGPSGMKPEPSQSFEIALQITRRVGESLWLRCDVPRPRSTREFASVRLRDARDRSLSQLKLTTASVAHPISCTQTFCTPGATGSRSASETIIFAVKDSTLPSA